MSSSTFVPSSYANDDVLERERAIEARRHARAAIERLLGRHVEHLEQPVRARERVLRDRRNLRQLLERLQHAHHEREEHEELRRLERVIHEHPLRAPIQSRSTDDAACRASR